ncbi:MAG: hypothetical protein ACI4MH_00300 [Candidatus Coproplasma sp.]
MLILGKDGRVDFNVIGYEFPQEKPSEKEFNYEANWLNLEIVYHDRTTDSTFTDNCLLTNDLSDLINALQNITDGAQDGYISDFFEPYLSVCITEVDGFIIFVFSYVYDTRDRKWSKITVTAKWTVAEAKEKLKELKDIELKFPIR